MVIVPLSKAEGDEGNAGEQPGSQRETSNPALRYAAAGTLIAGGALFVAGCRRSGLLAAVIGTALAMIDQQETMRVWWNALPVYLDEAQSLLNRVQGAMDDVSVQHEKLRQVFSRTAESA
ncbi:MAG TPA: hypothetical protein VGR47_12030 [Terracidiphilus sp.]|nr:hypothetical protein [Terracidiphilus sp.]